MGCSWEGHCQPGPSRERDVAARGERNHGRDSPIDCYRGNVGHGLLVGRALPRTSPAMDRPKSFSFIFLRFWMLFPLFLRPSPKFSWRHGGVGRTRTTPNAPICLRTTLRKSGGLSAPRQDPKGRPKQRETHQKKAKQKRETLQTAKQKRDFGVLPAQTAPHTAPCPGGPFRRRKDPSRNAGFLTTLGRWTFSP